MGDIISRIKLETVGADQASREIQKLKNAFEATERASKGISVSGQQDPFTKAVQQPMAFNGSAVLNEHSKYHREWLQQQRESQLSRNGVLGVANTASTMTQQIAGGNTFGAIGTGAGALGAMAGPIGIGLAVGAVAIKAIGALATKEEARIEQFYGSGMSQRLGGYETTRDLSIRYARRGVPMGKITSYLNAVSMAGGTLTGNTAGIDTGMEAVASLGLNEGVVAGLVGTFKMLGLRGSTYGDMFYRRLQGTIGNRYGAMGINQAIGATNSYLGQQMAGGTTYSNMTSAMSRGYTTGIEAYTQYGGLTIAGATQAMQLETGRAQQASGIKSAEDVVALQAIMKKHPELSITEAQIYMETHPGEVNQLMYESIISRSSDKDQQLLMARKWTGGNAREARNFLTTHGALATKGEAGLSVATDEETFGKGGEARKIYGIQHAQPLAGAEAEFAKLKAGIAGAVFKVDTTNMDARIVNIHVPTVSEQVPDTSEDYVLNAGRLAKEDYNSVIKAYTGSSIQSIQSVTRPTELGTTILNLAKRNALYNSAVDTDIEKKELQERLSNLVIEGNTSEDIIRALEQLGLIFREVVGEALITDEELK